MRQDTIFAQGKTRRLASGGEMCLGESMSESTRMQMTEDDIPTHWYTIAAGDMANPPSPPLPADGTPATPQTLRRS